MVTNAGSQSGPRRVALLLLTTVIGTAGCGSSVGPTDPGGAVQATEVGFERLEVAGVAFSRAGETFWITQVFIAP